MVSRELTRAFADVELEEEFAGSVARYAKATKRGVLLCEISGWFWSGA